MTTIFMLTTPTDFKSSQESNPSQNQARDIISHTCYVLSVLFPVSHFFPSLLSPHSLFHSSLPLPCSLGTLKTFISFHFHFSDLKSISFLILMPSAHRIKLSCTQKTPPSSRYTPVLHLILRQRGKTSCLSNSPVD